jgi:hypothetical protein
VRRTEQKSHLCGETGEETDKRSRLCARVWRQKPSPKLRTENMAKLTQGLYDTEEGFQMHTQSARILAYSHRRVQTQ